jgi:hypothetical protein
VGCSDVTFGDGFLYLFAWDGEGRNVEIGKID